MSEDAKKNDDIVPLSNLNRSIEDVLNEYGLGISFVLKKRFFPRLFV